MKNWLSIGEFSKLAGVSARTLRVYEDLGLIGSHARGENRYRYYKTGQLDLMNRIKTFKSLGFSLSDIKAMLLTDAMADSKSLETFLKGRRTLILQQESDLSKQKIQIDFILSSLAKNNRALGPSERRFIMSHFEEMLIVVTGKSGLETTAQHIQEHLLKAGQKVEVCKWGGSRSAPKAKPYILIVPEASLALEEIKELMPDIVVIKNLSQFNPEIERTYLNLYSAAGPHMTTVFNADDRLSVELAANAEIRKGRTFYFSKNSGLEEQIRNIGGVISDGEEIKIFGFNLKKGTMKLKLNRLLGFEDEISFLASITAVMDIGLDKARFESTAI